MREALAAVVVCLAACNQLFGIDDPPPGGDPCVGDCACRVDADCGAHEYCNDQIKTRTCDCVAGYARGGAACAWQGVIADPGFSNPAAWIAASMAAVDAAAAAPDQKDAGILRLARNSCAAAALQQIVMPRFERAEPLVAAMTYRIPDFGGIGGSGPAFGIGRTWSEDPPTTYPTQWATERRCLGAGHYAPADSTGPGEEVPLYIGRLVASACRYDTVELDRFDIVPANPGECPLPGQVVNGLADTDGGWTFTASSAGSAGFAAGVGENGSRGARMSLPQRCSSASAVVPLSPDLPDTAGGPSLSYYVSSTAQTSVYGYLGAQSLPVIPGNQPTIVRFCVPAHLRGAAQRLQVQSYYTAGGVCTDAVNASAVLDTVKLESTPACGTDLFLADPGFESGYLAETYMSGTGSVRSIEDAGTHGGTHMLELKMSSCASSAYAYVHAITPAPVGSAGPALAFWSRMTTGINAELQVYLSGGPSIAVPRDLQWRRGVMCLDPKLTGRHQQLFFYFSAPTCTGTFPAESAFIDDLEVTVDPSCPAM